MFGNVLQSELKVKCTFSARGRHTGIAEAEAMVDVLTRGAEASIMRRERSKHYLLTARLDYLERVNLMVVPMVVPAGGQVGVAQRAIRREGERGQPVLSLISPLLILFRSFPREQAGRRLALLVLVLRPRRR